MDCDYSIDGAVGSGLKLIEFVRNTFQEKRENDVRMKLFSTSIHSPKHPPIGIYFCIFVITC